MPRPSASRSSGEKPEPIQRSITSYMISNAKVSARDNIAQNLQYQTKDDSKGGGPSFPLMQLPAELRMTVYKFALVFHHDVVPTHIKELQSYKLHKTTCIGGSHSLIPQSSSRIMLKSGAYSGLKRYSMLLCKSAFTKETTSIYSPNSVLCLLEASRLIYHEALPIFYRHNRFAFSSGSGMSVYLRNCSARLRFLSEIVIKYNGDLNWVSAFQQLELAKHLTSIYIKVSPRLESETYGEWLELYIAEEGLEDVSLVESWDATATLCRTIKGVKEVVVIGVDYLYRN